MKSLLSIAAWILLCGTAMAQDVQQQDPYDLSEVDQRRFPQYADVLPPAGEERREYAEMLAYDAAIYGMAPALQYVQMHAQALDRANPDYTGFNAFRHGRALARPGYAAFKTPNADTLYSNAWLDLTNGPVILTVPDMGDTYFTVNFLDMYSNASNIGARTRGFGPGRYAIVPAGYKGQIPEGTERFIVATPYAWILLRILADDPENLSATHGLQEGFTLAPMSPQAATGTAFPAPILENASGFFRVVDWVLLNNGYPEREIALVARYRKIGLGDQERGLGQALRDPDVAAGMEQGLAKARQAISASRLISGYDAGSWKVPADIGAYGYNYLYRATINTLGTGGNLVEENYPFNTFHDGDGDLLDGSQHAYRLHLDPPPPADFFWSVTLYDADTKELAANPIDRYLISDRTPGLRTGSDGSVTIAIQKERPGDKALNWLPAPDGPFYLVLRAQGPDEALLEGEWLPPAVTKVR